MVKTEAVEDYHTCEKVGVAVMSINNWLWSWLSPDYIHNAFPNRGCSCVVSRIYRMESVPVYASLLSHKTSFS